MLASVRELWRGRRGRRAAVAAIAPFVERSRNRLNGIPAVAWIDPYMVGFVVMLITLVAKREIDNIDQSSLAMIQCEAWAEITGMTPEPIGERVLYLCATEHKEFELGCRNAHAFSQALTRSTINGPDDHLDSSGLAQRQAWDPNDDNLLTPFDNAALSALWLQYFDTRVIGPGLRQHPRAMA